jgi:hypothetical protein
MNYVRKLGFEETPDYDFLRELFTKVLKTLGEPDDGIFDWMLLNGGKGWEVSQRAKVGTSWLIPDCYSPAPRPTQLLFHIHLIAKGTATKIVAVQDNLYKISTRHKHLSFLVLRQLM